MAWKDEQKWELEWWGDCTNTFGEESKQISYAYRMGLVNDPIGEHWPAYDLEGKNILDIGGGPVSMLLKCRNRGHCVVVDPGEYPRWTLDRYNTAEIIHSPWKGEDLLAKRWTAAGSFDEVWIYNCLQHTESPDTILHGAAKCLKPGGVLRMFEWLDIPACPGHPWELTALGMTKWLVDAGFTDLNDGDIEDMKGENGCWGRAFVGAFSLISSVI